MLSALSKKLALSPRPLRRQAATTSDKSATATSPTSVVPGLISPYDTPENSPSWLRRSFPVPLLGSSLSSATSTRESSFESNPPESPRMFGAGSGCGSGSGTPGSNTIEIQIVVDPSSPEMQRKRLTRQTCSEPINPGLLGVHRMNTIDIVDHHGDEASGYSSSSTTLTPSPTNSGRNFAKSLPASPVTSPGSKRKYGSWRTLHRPKLRKSLSDVRPRSGNFMLLRSRKLSSFEVELMEQGVDYFIIGADHIKVNMEVEVNTLTLFIIYTYSRFPILDLYFLPH